jgi:MFS family permease
VRAAADSFARVSLLFPVAMLLAGAGLQSTLLSIRAGIEDFPIVAAGLVMSGYFAGYIVGSKVCGPLIYRVGHIRAFAAFAAVASAVPLLHGLFVDAVAWILLRSISGLCFFGLFMVMESWINGRTANADRGTWLAVYMKVNLGAQAAAQLLLNLAQPTDMTLFVVCAVLISNALVPVALTRSTPPKVPNTGKLGLPVLFRISPLGIVGCFCSGLSLSAFSGLAPLVATEIGFPVAMVSVFMSLTILGGAASQWPIGRLSDVIDRRLVIALVSFLGAAVSVLTALLSGEAGNYLLPLGFVFGASMFPLYSLCVALTNDFMRDDDLIAASGGLLLSYGLGALLGPYAASWAIEILGPAGLFAHIATVTASLGLFAIIRAVLRAPVPIADRERFVFVPETTPVAEALDPRTDRQETEAGPRR